MARTIIKEETRCKFVFTFLDETSRPVPPSSARWCVYNVTTDTDIADWADLNVPSNGQVEVTLPASYSRCTTTGDELISIGIEAEPGTEQQVSEEHELLVRNLRKSG